jgi:tetratricopeptide (TPR) repeat protein
MSAKQRRRERRLEAARGYLFLDMPDHALRELRDIGDPEECVYESNCLRGEALRQKKNFEAALAAFREADRAHPDSLDVLIGIAWCQKRIDRLPEAIATMEHAYAVAPEEPIVLYNLSCYHALAGDKSNALSFLGRAVRMDGSLRRLIPDERDFDSLRQDPHFRLIANPDECATA